MKEDFFGFYDPTNEEIEKSWTEGTFIFDANALLNLYRYSESTRKDFILAIAKLDDRLFMPYQVGLEYHTNRLNVIEGLKNSYYTIDNDIKELFENQLKDRLNKFKRHPSIDIEKILKIQDEFSKKIIFELEKQKTNHPDFIEKDEILEQLTEIYKNKVGKEFSKEELQKIYIEGKNRYDQQIPPGYKDLDTKKKRGDKHIYGDLIIWKEIISNTTKRKKPIVFVTDDRKEDWWKIENGKTIRPREELIKEFYDLTGIRILIYTADNFLQFAKERKLVSQIKETTISEVKEVRKADENYFNFLTGANSELYNRWQHILKPTIAYEQIFNSETLKNLQEITKPASFYEEVFNSEPYKSLNKSASFYEKVFDSEPYKSLNKSTSFYEKVFNSEFYESLNKLNNSVNSYSELLESDDGKPLHKSNESVKNAVNPVKRKRLKKNIEDLDKNTQDKLEND